MMPRVFAALAALMLVTPSPAAAPSPKAAQATLDSLAGLIEKNYVYKDKADTIAAELRKWKSDPAVTGAADERALANLLTERLRKFDRHFAVQYNPSAAKPGAPAQPSADAVADYMRSHNYGFDKVALLPGNVGYIKLRFFADFDTRLTGAKAPGARKAGEAALAFVQNADAVIFDLTQNGGGSPAMIDLLLSPFFDKPVLLNRFTRRHGDKQATEEYTTLANYAGAHRPAVPLYVLVSGDTASAAEEFSYDVKTQKRGLIVGKPTFGGANPGEDFDAGGGFTVFISTGAAVNPITGTNWEGTGVQPDITVHPSDALARAHADAVRQLAAKAKPGPGATALRWAAELDEAVLHPPAPQPLPAFAGTYGARKITVKDGVLFYARQRGPAQKAVALAADKFGLEESPDVRLSFHRDPRGGVDSLTVTSAWGENTPYARTGG